MVQFDSAPTIHEGEEYRDASEVVLPEKEGDGEEEKKDLDQDWHASVRGPSAHMSASDASASATKQRRTNRGSLDGTRRFRKVVTFRNSLVQTRLIAGRRQRGRNSLLPWFSSDSQQHTQEVLEEQERERAHKKAEKERKKAEKKQAKAAKKAEKKAKKNQRKNIAVETDSQPLVFEDGSNHELDLSLSLNEAMGGEVDHSRRRRSSISTAILDTMRLFSSRKAAPPPRQRFPRNAPRDGKDPSQSSTNSRKKNKSYDWSTHLQATHSKSAPTNNTQEQSNAFTRQQEIIDEEEEAYEQGLKALPKTNPISDASPDFNTSFAQAQNPNASAVLDISGESFADPSTSIPDAPKAAPRRGRRKWFTGSSKKKKKKLPQRKPTPLRLTSVQEATAARARGRGGGTGSNNSSISGPLADVIALNK